MTQRTQDRVYVGIMVTIFLLGRRARRTTAATPNMTGTGKLNGLAPDRSPTR